MIELLDLVRRQQARDPRAVSVFLSTHPAPEERLAAVRTAVGTRRGGLRDSVAFRSAKAHLRALPAARSMPAT
jgi:predicted Zn-dependent protease